MIIINPFDPSTNSSGTIQAATANKCGILYLINESNVALRLDLGGGNIAVLQPWFCRAYRMPLARQTVQWTVLYVLESASPPISQIHGEVYEPSEVQISQLPQGPLTRQLNLGNTINTNTANMTTLINDGQPALTQIIEIKQVGSTGSNVYIDNSGNVYIAQWNATTSTYTKLFQIVANAATGSSLILGNTGLTTEIDGTLSATGGITTTSITLTDEKIYGSGGWVYVDFTSGTDFVVTPNGGQFKINSGSLNATAGTFTTDLTLTSGSIFGSGGWNWISFSDGSNLKVTPNGGRFKINSASLQFTDNSLLNRIHGFSGTGSGTFNHQNGQQPNNIQVTTHAVGSQTMGYDSENATTVHITTGAGLAWQGLAFSLA